MNPIRKILPISIATTAAAIAALHTVPARAGLMDSIYRGQTNGGQLPERGLLGYPLSHEPVLRNLGQIREKVMLPNGKVNNQVLLRLLSKSEGLISFIQNGQKYYAADVNGNLVCTQIKRSLKWLQKVYSTRVQVIYLTGALHHKIVEG